MFSIRMLRRIVASRCILGNLDCQNWYPDPIEIDFGLSKNPFPKIQIPSHLANFPPELAQTNRLAKT